MTVANRDTDLRIVLEAADPGPVTRARIDDHVRTPLRIDGDAFWRHDPHQCVVDGPREMAAVDHRLVVEVQYRRHAGLAALVHYVAALAQRVPEQNRALRE